MRFPRMLAVSVGLGLLASVPAPGSWAQDHGVLNRFPPTHGFVEPQFTHDSSGTVLMLWGHRTGRGYDLYVVHRVDGTLFSDPTRANDGQGTVRLLGSDEMRPCIAAGPGGAVAVAWTDTRGDVMVALGSEHGSRFDSPLPLNQERGASPPSHVVVSFDDRGRLHAAWIDHRRTGSAGKGGAQLYYAIVERGRVSEQNLTGSLSLSVCAGSRPAILPLRRGEAEIYVRATDENGIQGVFQVSRAENGDVSPPRRLGEGLGSGPCAPAGPVHGAGFTAWWDRSSRKPGVRVVGGAALAPDFIPASDGPWALQRSPRFVASDEAGVVALLLQGNSAGRIFLRQGRAWKLVMEDVPAWCTAVAWIEGQILMAGQIDTRTMLEAKVVRW